MVEVEATWWRVAKVWWSLFWRGILFGMLAGFVLGFIIGFVATIVGIDKTIIRPLCGIAGAAAGIPVGLLVVKKVLQNRYGDFRIALLKYSGCEIEEKA